MAIEALCLADKSALARVHHLEVASRLGPLLTEGLIATCPIIDLEVLYSARSLANYEAILSERRAMPCYAVTAEVTDRAVEVQHQLARNGRHRLPLLHLLIAAVAEINNLTVMHYDSDYDRIAEITSQPVSWVVEQGSVS